MLKKKRFLFTQHRGSIYTVVVWVLLKLWLGSSNWPIGLSRQIPISIMSEIGGGLNLASADVCYQEFMCELYLKVNSLGERKKI